LIQWIQSPIANLPPESWAVDSFYQWLREYRARATGPVTVSDTEHLVLIGIPLFIILYTESLLRQYSSSTLDEVFQRIELAGDRRGPIAYTRCVAAFDSLGIVDPGTQNVLTAWEHLALHVTSYEDDEHWGWVDSL
jgi:hypothetical protein